jgi:hypothetical protein
VWGFYFRVEDSGLRFRDECMGSRVRDNGFRIIGCVINR